jgi:hypothetical protein
MTRTLPWQLFENRESIPELVPTELYLPADRRDLFVPKAAGHTDKTTTPCEVGHALFSGSFKGDLERSILENYRLTSKSTVELFESDKWGSHIGRTILRVVLDPIRLSPINMLEAYEYELESARFPVAGEETFFREFINQHGLFPRNNDPIDWSRAR